MPLPALIVLLLAVDAAPQLNHAPSDLPPMAVAQLARSLEAARAHARHVWRDTAPFDGRGLVNGFVEIARGDRRKWEFDMGTNARAVDRVMPEEVGGYPVNYGFVPQTVSYDGDPFDVLVLGPPLPGGDIVRGAIVGVMYMEDEKGLDSKVVISPVDANGATQFQLTGSERQRIGEFFARYKQHETGKFSRVPGWGSGAEGKRLIAITHAFFRECRANGSAPCRVHVGD